MTLIVETSRLLVGLVFVLAGAGKVAARSGFRGQLAALSVVPPRMVAPAAALIPAIELLAGAALLTGTLVRPAASFLGALLFIFTIGLALVLRRGQRARCGCFGRAEAGEIKIRTVLRNCGLIFLTALVFARVQDVGTLRGFEVVASSLIAAMVLLWFPLAREASRLFELFVARNAIGARGTEAQI